MLLVGELPIDVRTYPLRRKTNRSSKKGWRDTGHRCGLHAETFDSKVRELLCYQKKERGAATHTGRRRCLGRRRSRCTRNPPSDVEPTVKLYFSNTFNSVRRDTILANVAVKMPELYRFVKDSLDCNPMLIYGDDIIISAEGSQQGDPFNGLEFCESIQPTLLETEVGTTMGFVDDINLEGELSNIARDVQVIIDSNTTTGLFSTPESARLRPRTSK